MNKKSSIESYLKEFYFNKPVSGIESERLLSGARLALVTTFPFFGKVALNLKFIETNVVPAMSVNQRGYLFYNRKFVNHFEKKDAIWSVAHEALHIVERHWNRIPKGVILYLWNVAADMILESHLLDAGLEQSKLSASQFTPDRQKLARDLKTVPAVYKYLLQEAENNTDCEACKETIRQLRKLGKEIENNSPQEDDGTKPHDHSDNKDSCCSNCKDCNCSKKEKTPKHTCGLEGFICYSGVLSDLGDLLPEEQQNWLEKIIAAKVHAESKGNMPAGLGEYIDQLTKSKVRWQDHIKTAATRLFGRDRYTYKRTNRRGPAIRMRLPENVPDGQTAVGAIDTSASMSVEEIRQCISEFSAIIKACGGSKLWLILHDCRVYFSDWVKEADLTKLKMTRGGTSHIEVFQCLNRTHSNSQFNLPKEEQVSLAVLFTDLGTSFPTESPNFEVIWGVPSNGSPGISVKVPFGKKIEVETSNE